MTNMNNNDELKVSNKFVLNMTKTVDEEFTVLHNDRLQHYLKVPVIEEKYNAKYVGEFTLPAKDGGWINQPAMLFFSEDAQPG